jgi:hypothetical protein
LSSPYTECHADFSQEKPFEGSFAGASCASQFGDRSAIGQILLDVFGNSSRSGICWKGEVKRGALGRANFVQNDSDKPSFAEPDRDMRRDR